MSLSSASVSHATTQGYIPRMPAFFHEITSSKERPSASREFLLTGPNVQAHFRAREQQISSGAVSFGIRFLHSSPAVIIEPTNPQSGIVNSLVGAQINNWKTNSPTYDQLAYRGIYPGVDMICRVQDGHLKSDFVVAPGGDPFRIQVQYTGVVRTFVDEDGALVIQTQSGVVKQAAPVILQQRSGEPGRVWGAYHRLGLNTFGIVLGVYDHNKTLIIDPILTSSTFLGGSSLDLATSVTVDGIGNIYLTGWTDSNDFPTVSPGFLRGRSVDAFVAKLDPTGTTLIYCTYLGGSEDDRGTAIAVDTSGNAYVAGTTNSPNFPIFGTFQQILKGSRNAFIAKLNATGSPVFSTYFGGSGSDTANAIAIGPTGSIYFTGASTSTDLPVSAALQTSNHGQQDVFIAQLSPSGSTLVFCSYIGGKAEDSALAITLDSAANVYVAGGTTSSDFPTVNALQPRLNGPQDAFVLKLSPDGQSILYSTYLGGSGGGNASFPEMAAGIAVDNSGNAYIAGMTPSTDFPVLNAAQSHNAGVIDAFVVKLNPAGQMLYSTYLGGVIQDYATSISVDALQNAYITGYTASPDFPTLFPVQSVNAGSYDVFLTKLDWAGRIAYSTYLGGSGSDAANSVWRAGSGQVYVAGQTLSYDFPLISPIQSINGAGFGAFLAVVREPACAFSISPASAFVGVGVNRGSVTVTTTPGCDWIAASNAPSLSISSGSSGIGSGTVSYSIAANTSSAFRTVTLTIAGQPFTVTQAGAFAKVGVFRQGYYWILDVDGNQQINIPPDRAFALGGIPGDLPITGDWNGDGSTKVGVYRSSSGVFLLDYAGNGQISVVYNLGVGTVAGDVPVMGDWNGDGKTKVGLFRQGFLWILDYNGNGVFEQGLDKTYAFGGIPGDIPVVGDWNGNGRSKVGLFRGGFLWILDITGNGVIDGGTRAFPFGGIPGDVPIVGDWNGDGRSKVGVFRGGFFLVLDANGNYRFDGIGPGQDMAFGFGGIAGDKPVIGKW